jgi:PAS domain-containing protein
MNTVLVLSPYIGSIIVSLTLAEYALRRRRVPAALPFSVVAASQALWTVGYIFELLATSLDAKIEWDSAQYIFEFSMTIAVVIMVRDFRRDQRKVPVWLWIAWLFIPVLCVVGFLSEPWHHQLRQSARILPAAPSGALWYDFHWLDWVAAAWNYGSWITTVVLLILHARKGSRLVRRQALALVVGCLIPIVMGTVLVYVATPLPQRDPAPFIFLAGNLAFGWGLFRAGLFDLLPVAREILVQQMSDGVVVVDPRCRVIDANPAAESILEHSLSRMLGQHFGEISTRMQLELPNDCHAPATSKLGTIHDTERWYEITCHPVSNALGASLGRLYVMHDVTAARNREFDLEARVMERTQALSLEIEQRKRTEAALSASEARFRAIFNQTFEFVGLLDTHGTVLDANQTALEFIGGDLRSVVGRPFGTPPGGSVQGPPRRNFEPRSLPPQRASSFDSKRIPKARTERRTSLTSPLNPLKTKPVKRRY